MTRMRLLILSSAMLLVATYLIVVFTYHLEHGDTWNVGEGAVIEQGVANHPMTAGYTTEIAITIRNSGILPITLSNVRLIGSDIEAYASGVLERAGETPDCCLRDHAGSFHPVTIEPRQQAMVWLRLKVTGRNSYSPCTGLILEQVSVDFVVMKMPRVTPVLFRTPIMFRSAC